MVIRSVEMGITSRPVLSSAVVPGSEPVAELLRDVPRSSGRYVVSMRGSAFEGMAVGDFPGVWTAHSDLLSGANS
jgi:hypothetical protein